MLSRQMDCTKRSAIRDPRCGIVWGRVSVAEIRLQEGESIENAIRRFKRKVLSEDIIREVKRHSYYLKPGEKRRVKQALARKRARKKIRKEGFSVNASHRKDR
jgi:small subunit ribosomal protein S21